MKRRTSLLSVTLALAGFLATAQINSTQGKLDQEVTNFNLSNIEMGAPLTSTSNQSVPSATIKKQKSGDDWWQPDTVYHIQPDSWGINRYVYQYNQKGLLVAEIAQYQQDDTWMIDGQCTYTYDANNNLLTKLHENWGSWPWEMYSRYTYTYDSNNNLLIELVEDRNDDTWVNNRQEIMTYDENNNMITQLLQSWNQNNHTWGSGTLNTYTYDSNNNMLTRLIQTRHNDNWQNFYLYSYTYDANNNRLTEFFQTWANNDSGWIDRVLYTYTYDANNNMLTELYEDYTISSKEASTYTYDANNKLIHQLTKTWQNEEWINKSQINWTYDSKNNILEWLRELWKNSAWENDIRRLWTYDENDNCILAENFSLVDGSWYPLQISTSLYYNNMQSLFYYQNQVYKVSATYRKVAKPTAIEDFASSAISVYPNPTSGQLHIKTEEQNIQMITVYNLFGVQLFEIQDATFDISHLATGIYIVQVKTKEGILVTKITKL